MKSELIKVKGRGICILISDINVKDLGGNPRYGMHYNDTPFNDLEIIAREIRNERKIMGIKEIRKQTGWGLKDAKYYIDRYMPSVTIGTEGYDYNEAADKFIKDHSYIIEGEFISATEIEIL